MTGVVGTDKYLQSETFSVTLNLFRGPFRRSLRFMRDEFQPCVYILASRLYGTLYIGVTSNLVGRLWQHRNGEIPGFTQRYKVHILVHFELLGDMERAISREK